MTGHRGRRHLSHPGSSRLSSEMSIAWNPKEICAGITYPEKDEHAAVERQFAQGSLVRICVRFTD
jgi:hypothetical protein